MLNPDTPQRSHRPALSGALWLIGLLLASSFTAQGQRTQGAGGNQGLGTGSATGTRQYYGNGMVGEAMISSDPETRQLIVITDEETNLHISQIITNLDTPKPQVLIKVVFLEVTTRDGYDIGVEAGNRRELNSTTALLASNVFGLASQGTTPIPPGAGFYQLMGTDYEVTLRAIAAAGKTEVLSRPSILARNNQQATIIIGQEIPFITDSRITDAGQTINTIQYDDIGIILRVTPFITSDGLVEMIVSPEISNLTDETVPVANGVSAPVIAKRSADTVVVTPNGQTIIIGGLMGKDRTEAVSKIPILGDIPLLGILFRRKVKDESKTELLIFLTPYIVNRPSQLMAMTEKERGDNELVPKSFSEQELQRFLGDPLPEKETSDKPKTPDAAQPAPTDSVLTPEEELRARELLENVGREGDVPR